MRSGWMVGSAGPPTLFTWTADGDGDGDIAAAASVYPRRGVGCTSLGVRWADGGDAACPTLVSGGGAGADTKRSCMRCAESDGALGSGGGDASPPYDDAGETGSVYGGVFAAPCTFFCGVWGKGADVGAIGSGVDVGAVPATGQPVREAAGGGTTGVVLVDCVRAAHSRPSMPSPAGRVEVLLWRDTDGLSSDGRLADGESVEYAVCAVMSGDWRSECTDAEVVGEAVRLLEPARCSRALRAVLEESECTGEARLR